MRSADQIIASIVLFFLDDMNIFQNGDARTQRVLHVNDFRKDQTFSHVVILHIYTIIFSLNSERNALLSNAGPKHEL